MTRDGRGPRGEQPGVLGLYTDLYELRMLESYLRLSMFESATFSLFARASPECPWLVAAGLDLALEVLDHFHYETDELLYLRERGLSDAALEWLRAFQPSGELWAVEPGTVLLGEAPLLELTAPLPVAQLLEAALLNAVHYDCAVATQAARCVRAARGRPVVDFGFRRAPGLESGMRAALASFVGGISATSNVEAGYRFGIPVSGTMAHSFVQAFASERRAFVEFARDHPSGATLLIDTYDPERGLEHAIEVLRELEPAGVRVRALRLDCEPLLQLSQRARARLDAARFGEVELFASGGLDAKRIAALLRDGAPIDGFGVGSALVSGSEAATDIVYKLVEYAGEARAKYSFGKQTLPGAKQIFRRGSPVEDVLELRTARASGKPLLQPVWRDGERLWQFDHGAARARCQRELASLAAGWGDSELDSATERAPALAIGPELQALATRVRERDWQR